VAYLDRNILRGLNIHADDMVGGTVILPAGLKISLRAVSHI